MRGERSHGDVRALVRTRAIKAAIVKIDSSPP
jgi:hypothetical protein